MLGLLAVIGGCRAPVTFPTVQASQPAHNITEQQKASLPDPNPPYKAATHKGNGLRRYYAMLQQRLLKQGKLRTDAAGPDMTYSSRDLVRDFDRIALHSEYISSGRQLVSVNAPSVLKRWSDPINAFTVFSASVPPSQRDAARRNVQAMTQKLSRASGHPVRMGSRDNANLYLLFIAEEDRAAYAQAMQAAIPEIDPFTLSTVQAMPRNQLCLAITFPKSKGSPYIGKTLVVIRAENPGLLRQSCIHEEMAQAMGLPNDSFTARPSIFNDDEEFALLTKHDEQLLQILYDRRLKPGMTRQEALPIVNKIVSDLNGR